MITTETCLVVTCTRCGQVDPDEGYDTLHAANLDQLRAWLPDWQWSDPDTPDLCPACVAEAACERDGHPWSDWRPSAIAPEWRFRSCDRCHVCEREPAHTSPSPALSGRD
ncbi:hypothetical protein ACIBKY_39160 [Nonomuraea sp. NPDC050394]|uniref:hypothetical protein n=1 Tax=Nonomuraea sp. NPDC050394 TaxID=3364363 RepID=UPI003798ED16